MAEYALPQQGQEESCDDSDQGQTSCGRRRGGWKIWKGIFGRYGDIQWTEVGDNQSETGQTKIKLLLRYKFRILTVKEIHLCFS